MIQYVHVYDMDFMNTNMRWNKSEKDANSEVDQLSNDTCYYLAYT